MNAVMKEHTEEKPSELAVIEPKSLACVLVIDDQMPDDFFTNTDYDKRLDAAIYATKDLAYSLDDSGEKQAKNDATSINKFATLFDKFIAGTFKAQTESVSLWRDNKKKKTKELLANRQRLIDQFAEKRQERLDSITTLLANTLAEYRIEIGLRTEFYGEYDLSPMVKLSGTLTDGGKLTSKALGFVKTIANGKLTIQQRFDSRILILENRCLRAEIIPPLTQVHLGAVMLAEDDIFNAKVDELVNAEIERRTEMATRIKKQNEADNQKKINDALKTQQDEANRITRENAQKETVADNVTASPKQAANEAEKVTPESLRKTADSIAQGAQYADRNEDRNRELASAAKLRNQANELEQQSAKQSAGASVNRTVIITATFEFTEITERTSNEGVEKFFRSKLPEQMQSKLSSLSSCNA